MKVHHLNCGTMHNLRVTRCVCHVLLVETDNGLVLVDTGHRWVLHCGERLLSPRHS